MCTAAIPSRYIIYFDDVPGEVYIACMRSLPVQFLPLPCLPSCAIIPQVTFKNNRRSLEVGSQRYRETYKDGVTGHLLAPWACASVVKAVQRQTVGVNLSSAVSMMRG